MKFLASVKNKILYPMCTYTVLICLFLFLITLPTGLTSAIVSTVFYLILGYSLGITLINFVLKTHKLNIVLRYIIHFVLHSALFFVFIKLVFAFYEKNLSQSFDQQSNSMIISGILFIFLYACIAGLTGLLQAMHNKAQEKKKSYESIFNQQK